jgi:hypothetical protein
MPRVRRKVKLQRRDLATPRTVERLLTGEDWDWLDEPGHKAEALTLDELAEAWEELRDELLALYQGGQPFQRPWAWWEFDSPEARRQVKPGPEPLGLSDYFGIPSRFKGPPPAGMYETERAYLTRLGLLTAEEKELLARHEAQEVSR